MADLTNARRNPRFKDLHGRKFDRLLVLEAIESTAKGWLWRCRCDCGKKCPALAKYLLNGNKKSCGCYKLDTLRDRSATHGRGRRGDRAPEYGIWATMLSRCYNRATRAWPHYGGRGITVCERWRKDFAAFLADVGPRPGSGYSLERINNGGNYEPGNVVWATRKAQANNKRSNVRIEFQGSVMTLQRWSERLNVPYYTLWSRLRRGWGVERALAEPIHTRFRNHNRRLHQPALP